MEGVKAVSMELKQITAEVKFMTGFSNMMVICNYYMIHYMKIYQPSANIFLI